MIHPLIRQAARCDTITSLALFDPVTEEQVELSREPKCLAFIRSCTWLLIWSTGTEASILIDVSQMISYTIFPCYRSYGCLTLLKVG